MEQTRKEPDFEIFEWEREKERVKEGEECAQTGQYIGFEHTPCPLSFSLSHTHMRHLSNQKGIEKNLPPSGFELTTFRLYFSALTIWAVEADI